MPEQDISTFESLSQTAKEKLAIGLIGLAGLGSLAVAEQANTEPAKAANVPEATASDQLQDCVNEALARPKIGYTDMIYPGDRRKQQVSTSATLAPVSPDCLPLINRETPKIFFKMQRPKNHKAWSKTKSQPMAYNNEPIDGNEGGKGGAFVWADYGSGSMRNSHFLYRCTPGNGITHVRAVYKLKVDSSVDGHTLGRSTYSRPVKIRRVLPLQPVQGGGVRRAC